MVDPGSPKAEDSSESHRSPTSKGSGIPPISPRHGIHHSPTSKGNGIPPISPRHGKELHFRAPAGRDRSKSLGQFPSAHSVPLPGTSGSLLYPPSPYENLPSASPILTPGGTILPSPGMPYMPNLQAGGQTRVAMEHAVESERKRRKEMEKEEENLSADELRLVLKRERNRMSRLAADLAALKSASVQSQAEAEVHEEGIVNNLMRRVENLQKEKGRIIIELEREEEMLTNTLQKKLDEVKHEKALLEQQIEKEQTHHTELQSVLSSIKSSKGSALDEA